MTMRVRHTQPRNETSRKKRLRGISKYDRRESFLLQQLYFSTQQQLFLSFFLGNEELTANIAKCQENTLRRWFELTHYHENDYVRLPRHTLTEGVIRTIDQALEKCGHHQQHEFTNMFKFTPQELKIICRLLPESFYLPQQRRGKITDEEGIMYLAARLKNANADLRKIANFFARDEAHISAYIHEVSRYLLEEYGHLLDVKQMRRWNGYLDSWERAISTKIFEKIPEETYIGRFQGCNVVMDGVRLYVSLPQESETASLLVNPYLGNEATLVFIGIVGANGMVVGLTEGCPGRENDTGAANLVDLYANLRVAGMKAMADSIFPHNDECASIPKRDQWHSFGKEDLKAFSSARVTVEWAFGEITSHFDYLRHQRKLQVGKTFPAKLFRVGVLMANFLKCFRAPNATTYFNQMKMSFETYVTMPPLQPL